MKLLLLAVTDQGKWNFEYPLENYTVEDAIQEGFKQLRQLLGDTEEIQQIRIDCPGKFSLVIDEGELDGEGIEGLLIG